MSDPTTSVIIPVRNGALYVGEAIASALAQLDNDDEVIVVDDGSTDQTSEVLENVADRRLKCIVSGGRGVSAARNTGLAAARGRFIAFLDHDDVWPEFRHDVLAGVLNANADLDAVFGRMRVKFEAGAQWNERFAEMDRKHVGVVSVGTGLFCRKIIDLVSGFDEGLHFGEDVDFYLRLVEAGMRVRMCDIDGLIYRRHQSNSSNDISGMTHGMNDVLRRRILRMRKTARRD